MPRPVAITDDDPNDDRRLMRLISWSSCESLVRCWRLLLISLQMEKISDQNQGKKTHWTRSAQALRFSSKDASVCGIGCFANRRAGGVGSRGRSTG